MFEKTKRIPDLKVSAGIRRFEETDDNAFMVGFSLPLPLYDRNQGGILEARHNLARTIQARRATDVRVKTALIQARQVLSVSYEEALALKRDALPAAQLAFKLAQEGYQHGKFGYLEVLDAQRTLFETKARYIDALAAYHKSMADTERLIGGRLDTREQELVPKEADDEK